MSTPTLLNTTWGVVNQTSPFMSYEPIQHFDSYLHSSLGFYHPQSLFEYYYQLMCSSFSSYAIITYGSFLCQILFYFGLSTPSLFFPFFPFMSRYKIQSNRQWTWGDQWQCFKKVATAKFGIYLPLAMFLYWILHHYHMTVAYSYESMPNWYELCIKIYISLIIEDTWHYWCHRAFHLPSLYGKIHKIHHNFSSPFALTAEYAHPLETLILGIGFFIPLPFFFNHLFYFWSWLFIRMLETIDVHSGYDVWWINMLNPLHYLPFYGGAQFHDYHHKRFDVNYASTFRVWDWICGTDKLYKEHLNKVKEETRKKEL